jgi:hypothetical protein
MAIDILSHRHAVGVAVAATAMAVMDQGHQGYAEQVAKSDLPHWGEGDIDVQPDAHESASIAG